MSIRKLVFVPTAQTSDKHLRPYSELTERGRQMAEAIGVEFHPDWFKSCLIHTCPYTASVQTTRAVLGTNQHRLFYDTLLRPQNLGDKPDHMIEQEFNSPSSRRMGFYYQFVGGESLSQVYDRVCSFLNFIVWRASRDSVPNVLVVADASTILCAYLRMHGEHPNKYDQITIRQPVQFFRNDDQSVFEVSGIEQRQK